MDEETKAKLNNYKAMDLIDFFPVPHLGNFPFKNNVKKIIKEYSDINLITFSNNQAILINDSEIITKNS